MNELKEKLRNTGLHILAISRNELYISMRFLDIALASAKAGDEFINKNDWHRWGVHFI